MPEKLTIEVYSIDELSGDARKNAIEQVEKEYDFPFEWWYENLLDNYAELGIEVKSFDVYYGLAKGEFILDAEEVAENLIRETGGDLQEIGRRYKEEFEALDENSEEYDFDREQLEEQFKKEILQVVVDDLRSEYEYYTSEEGVVDFAVANDIMFLENGNIFNG